MNKILKGLLVLALVGGCVKAESNKTFDKTRPYGVNLAMEYTTWNELIQMKDEDRCGANFQLTGFYQKSNESEDLGQYFGAYGKHKFTLANDPDEHQVPLYYIIHDILYASTDLASSAEIKYNPSQEAYGVRIDYYQDLRKIVKGLYLKAVLPVVHVKNEMDLDVDDVTGVSITKANMYHYYKGDFTGLNSTTNLQKHLEYAKIHDSQSTTQIADIDVVLGWKFWDKAKSHISINLGLTIPTSKEAEGKWVFEPNPGNNDHWAFGGGFDFGVNLWTKKDQNIKFEGALNYRYLFEEDEKRTLRLKDLGDTIDSQYSQYFLLVKAGDPAGTALTPAANVLTKTLEVTPGSQIDAIAQLAYNNGGFRLELGYNLFWKDEEEVEKAHLKHDTWGLAKPDLNVVTLASTGQEAHANVVLSTDALLTLDHHNINSEAATTPSQLTNKIYGGFGYMFKEWEYPLMLGIAAHYEFADTDEGGIQNWGIWGKIGMAF